MAKWNWGGAAVGLLSGVASEAQRYEQQQMLLEERRIQEARETRKLEAQLAKEQALAKFQANLQAERDEAVFGRSSMSEQEKRAYQDKKDAEDRAWKEQQADKQYDRSRGDKKEDQQAALDNAKELASYNASLAEQKGGSMKQMFNDLLSMGYSQEEAKSLITAKQDGTMTDAQKRNLYQKSYADEFKTLMEGTGYAAPTPEQRAEFERKAEAKAAAFASWSPEGSTPQTGGGLLSSATAGAKQNGPQDMPSKKEDLVEGQTYNTSRGPAVWRNGKFYTR